MLHYFLKGVYLSYQSAFSHIYIIIISEFTFFDFILDTDECSPVPCQNGGQCNDQVNSYTCSCAAGYEGTNCGTGEILALIHLV